MARRLDKRVESAGNPGTSAFAILSSSPDRRSVGCRSTSWNCRCRNSDPEIAGAGGGARYQQQTLEMIASENFVPLSVLEFQGSVLTNSTRPDIPVGATTAVASTSASTSPRNRRSSGPASCSASTSNSPLGDAGNTATYDAPLRPHGGILALEEIDGGHMTNVLAACTTSLLTDRSPRLPDRHRRGAAGRPRTAPAADRRGKVGLRPASGLQAFRAIADEVGAYLPEDMTHFGGLVAGC